MRLLHKTHFVDKCSITNQMRNINTMIKEYTNNLFIGKQINYLDMIDISMYGAMLQIIQTVLRVLRPLATN